jgi:succinate dehydrogenase/fumarate reductase flavoprotein subunit
MNGIDLARQPVEVAPIAHYHMGGIRVDETMRTRVPGLYACGEAVGGANGANRLSGNAITEALVFGACAGRVAAENALRRSPSWRPEATRSGLELLRSAKDRDAPNLAAIVVELKKVMADMVGPFRTGENLALAMRSIERLKAEIGEVPVSSAEKFDPVLMDWLDLRNMLLVAQSVTLPALARTESRGGHQREDYPALDDNWTVNQIVGLSGGQVHVGRSKPSGDRSGA